MEHVEQDCTCFGWRTGGCKKISGFSIHECSCHAHGACFMTGYWNTFHEYVKQWQLIPHSWRPITNTSQVLHTVGSWAIHEFWMLMNLIMEHFSWVIHEFSSKLVFFLQPAVCIMFKRTPLSHSITRSAKIKLFASSSSYWDPHVSCKSYT